jgi:anti-anti-sigma factor
MTDFAITSDGPRMFFLSGELDLATLPLMESTIASAVAKGGPITLDLSDLTFIDSSGVGSILGHLKALPSGCIILHGVRSAVLRVVEVMGIQLETLHVIPCTVPI